MKCFVVTEPKPREIFAAEFRDRVVHHLVITVMEPIWERKFIHTSFACRKGKGVHWALKHLQTKVREISRGGRSPVWVLQLDLARFFVSIHRPTLCALMEKHAPFPEIRKLIHNIYRHDGRIGAKIKNPVIHRNCIPEFKSWFGQPKDRGLPIGNLTSQFGANVYLTALDHFVQRELKPMAYMRYMAIYCSSIETPRSCVRLQNRSMNGSRNFDFSA
jgi:RNA-directed DNA polymerase